MTRSLDHGAARATDRRLELISLAASVLANDDLAARMTGPERLALGVLAREIDAMLGEVTRQPAGIVPFRLRP